MANQNTIADLSTTPASNLNFKGQSIRGTAVANTIDTMFQNEASMLKAFYDSLGGVATVSGTDTYTVTITEDWAAYGSALWLAIKPANANTGAATLNVTVPTAGALGAKAIRRQGDSALQANDMVANGVYLLRYSTSYNSSAGAWVLLNGAAASGVTTATASTVAGRDSSANLSADSFISGYATTATAAGTTTLTVDDKQQQYFTGTSTQTVVLPVTSTLVLGQQFIIYNNSTGRVTVQSSGANTIQVMGGTGVTFAPGAPGTKLVVTCVSTSGTGTASWSYEYYPPTTAFVAYTGGTNGLGTTGSQTLLSRRVGDSLEVIGRLTTGTTTAVEARLNLGFNGADAPSGLTIDSGKVAAAIPVSGGWKRNASATLSYAILTGGLSYVTFSIDSAPFTSVTANVQFGNSETQFFHFFAPITNW